MAYTNLEEKKAHLRITASTHFCFLWDILDLGFWQLVFLLIMWNMLPTAEVILLPGRQGRGKTLVLGTPEVNDMKSLWTGAVASGRHNQWQLSGVGADGITNWVSLSCTLQSLTRHSVTLVLMGQLFGTKSRVKKGLEQIWGNTWKINNKIPPWDLIFRMLLLYLAPQESTDF